MLNIFSGLFKRVIYGIWRRLFEICWIRKEKKLFCKVNNNNKHFDFCQSKVIQNKDNDKE